MPKDHSGGEVILRPGSNGLDFYIVQNQHLFLSSATHTNQVRIRMMMTFLLSVSLWSVPRFSNATTTTSIELVTKTNIVRAEYGLNILITNPRLEQAALTKANDMLEKNYFNHTAPSGALPWDFITATDYHFTAAGENLARQLKNSEEIFNTWMSSSRHRENILSTKYRDIGIATVNGILNGKQTTLVVQFFGNRQSIDTPVSVSYTAARSAPMPIVSESNSIAPASDNILTEKFVSNRKSFEQLIPQEPDSLIRVPPFQVIHNPSIIRPTDSKVDVRVVTLVLSALSLYATMLMGIWMLRQSVYRQIGIPIFG